jgi:hypothetical protein
VSVPDRNIPPVNPDAVFMIPGGDPLLGWIIHRVSGTGVGTNAGVTVTLAADSGLVYCVTGIQVSGDLAALVTIESPVGTVIWRTREVGAFTRPWVFPPGLLQGAMGAATAVKISASTANCEANIQAFSVNWNDLAVTDPSRAGRRIFG